MPLIRLWVRAGDRPKVIVDRPRGPGEVYDVEARTADEARRTLVLSLAYSLEDLDDETRMRWELEVELARRKVKRITDAEVTRGSR